MGRYREDGACLDCFYAANSIWLYSEANKYSAFERLKPNDPHPAHSHIPRPVQPNGLGGFKNMTEIVNDIVAQIDQIIFWLKVTVYLVMGICVVWLIGFIRRNLGLDTHSIELRRIRRLLEGQNSDK